MNKLFVVIPALNEENLILKTLDSLSRQTRKDFSVIIVDNGSTDNTKNLILKYSESSIFPIILLNEQKSGVGYARNSGSLKAIEMGAIYISGTDADTLLPKNWVESIYNGFKDDKYDLLSGECDPFLKIKLDNNKAQFVLDARSQLFQKVKPYFRGANFAITSKMFIKSGGFIQPLTKDRKPAPGEDGALELSALKRGGKICGCLATVFPHPRRYISNLQKINEFKGSVHEGGIVTQVRDEDNLEKYLKDIPAEVIDSFLSKIVVTLFNEFIIEIYKNPVLNKIYWKKSLALLKPFTIAEIEKDVSTNTDKSLLWLKYKDSFFSNLNS